MKLVWIQMRNEFNPVATIDKTQLNVVNNWRSPIGTIRKTVG